MAKVSLNNLSKSFGKVEVIKDIDLEIHNHEFTVFVGPSGCGKSTLLRLIAGLEDATQGEILIGEEPVTNKPPAKRGVAMVFQSYALYPHMSVYQNIAFGIRSLKNRALIKEKVQETAKILKIDHLLDRKPKQLSGGQRQRVAIGRAIIREPRVFLFDEPLSNLDASLRVEMRMQIARLKTKLNKTMIYVTHDQVEAMTLADKIVVLQNGRIEQVGSPLELYNNPRNLFVAGFLGSPRMNFLNVIATKIQNASFTVQLPQEKHLTLNITLPTHIKDIKVGSSAVLGIRPEHFVECPEKESLISGKVRMVEHLGSEIYAYIRADGSASLLVRTAGDHPVKIGDIMHFKFDPNVCHLFHKKSEMSLSNGNINFEKAALNPLQQ